MLIVLERELFTATEPTTAQLHSVNSSGARPMADDDAAAAAAAAASSASALYSDTSLRVDRAAAGQGEK